MKYCFSFLSFLAVFLLSGHSVLASGGSLREVLDHVYSTNPGILAERASFRSAARVPGQAWAGALPQVVASGSVYRNDLDESVEPYRSVSGSVVVEQSVFDGFGNYHTIRQANAQVRAAEAGLADFEQQTLLEAATVYFDVWLRQSVYEFHLGTVDLLMRQSEMAKLRFEVGQVTRTDVMQARARLSDARAMLSRAKGNLAYARAVYAQVVGQEPVHTRPGEKLPDLPESLDRALELAAVHSPLLLFRDESVEIARRQIAISRSALFPNISAQVAYQYSDNPSPYPVMNGDQLTAGINASFPIFQGGYNHVVIARAREEYAGERATRLQVERYVKAQVIRYWQDLLSAKASILSTRASVEANTLAYEGVQREAEVGTRTTLEVLDAEQELLDSRVSHVSARRDEYVAAFSLLYSIGLLSPEVVELAPVNAVHNADIPRLDDR